MKLGLRALRGALVVTLLASVVAPLAAAPAHAVAPSGAPELLSPGPDVPVGGNPTFSWRAVAGATKYRVEVSRTPAYELASIVYKTDTYNLHATPADPLPLGTLYWRVAGTAGTAAGPFAESTFVHEWAAGPSLIGPGDGAPLTYPTDPLLFTWNPLPGAQKYNVQVDDDPEFVGSTPVTTNNTSYTLVDPQTNEQTFYWRVQGVSGSILSPWSTTRSYHVSWPTTPNLVSPKSGDTVTDVVLQWDAVPGAAKYQVEISSAKDFTNNVILSATVLGTRYSPAKTVEDDQYFWRVRALDGKGSPNFGAWSDKVLGQDAMFHRRWHAPPTLRSPENPDYNVTNPVLRWTPVPYASHYEIHLASDLNFSSATTVSCYTNQTAFTPYGVVNGGTDGAQPPGTCNIGQNKLPVGNTVYWKVRGIDAGPTGPALLGAFSEAAEFTFRHHGIPAVVSPAPNAVVTTPLLSWEPVLGVARYRVNVFSGSSHVSGSPFVTYASSLTPPKLEAGKPYSWYVQTLDDQGRPGSFLGSQSFTYQPAEALAASPLHLAPLEGAASPLMPSLSWQPVLGAKSYDVWLGRLGSDLLFKGNTYATTFTPSEVPTAPGTYAWSIEARSETGSTLGEPSAPTTFVLGDLEPVTGYEPGKCGVDDVCQASPDTPTLSWNPVMHASGYRVYIANDAGFQNEVREYKTQHTSLTPRESLLDSFAGKAYYYFVRPCRDANLGQGCGKKDASVLSNAGEFRKESTPVELISPANGVTVPASGPDVADITFTWNEYSLTNGKKLPPAAQGAKAYRIEVATAADFAAGTVVDSDTVDQATYTPHDVTYPEGPLFWRVRAIDGSGNLLAVSETRQLTKATPKLAQLHPLHNDVVTVTPYFRWAAQPHAKDYELMVAKNGDTNFSSTNVVPLVGSSPTVRTRLTAYTPLTTSLPAGMYAWRVRRLDANPGAAGPRPGPWSEVKLFSLTSGAPTLYAPADGTVVNNNAMLFTWSPVAGASRYEFVSSASPSFTPSIEKVSTVMQAWAPSAASYPDGKIYWRVSALNAQGQPTGVSGTSTITRDVTAPKVLTKSPTTSAPLAGGPFTVTFSEDVKGLSASSFVMRVTSNGAAVAGNVSPTVDTVTKTATFTPKGVLTPGETYTLSLGSGVTDVNGNPLTPFSWTVRAAQAVDATSPAVQHYWDRDVSTSASGGGYVASRTKGAKIAFTVTGPSASILGRRAPDGGYGEVWVGGTKKATVSFYSSTVRWKQVVWSTTTLPEGTHKVELRVLGTKPAAATSSWAYVDAVRYAAATVEETSSTQVVQSHANVAKSTALGGSYAVASHLYSGDTGTQPYVTMKFKGTGVQWKAFRSTSGGIAKVYVDGALRATVDTYGSTTTSPVALWSATGLTNATHTVKIVVTGTRRTGSGGYNVAFDSFSVT